MEGYGVDGYFLSFLKGLYGGSVSQVRIAGCLGEEFEVVKGLRQGGEGGVIPGSLFFVHQQFGN